VKGLHEPLFQANANEKAYLTDHAICAMVSGFAFGADFTIHITSVSDGSPVNPNLSPLRMKTAFHNNDFLVILLLGMFDIQQTAMNLMNKPGCKRSSKVTVFKKQRNKDN